MRDACACALAGLRRRPARLLALVLLSFGMIAGTALALTGKLTQLSGTDGCVSNDGSGGDCADGKALDGANSVALSLDRKSAYVASGESDAVDVFSRNTTSGKLTQLSGTDACVSENGTGGDCVDGKALDGAAWVAVSPDGKSVYVASYSSNAVAAFSRNTTSGKLTQLSGTDGCVSETGTGGECQDGKALDGPSGVAVSPDGKSVYVESQNSDAVAVFSRNTTTGALSQLSGTDACVSETGTSGQCQDGKALDGAVSSVVSADGKSVYVTSRNSDAVAVFSRNTTTGALSQLSGTDACVSETGTSGQCQDGKALDETFSVAASRDGKSVYTASGVSDAVAVFSRNATTGALNQLSGTDGCVSKDGTGGQCIDGKALGGANSVVVSRDKKSVYVTAPSDSAVAVFSRNTTTGKLTQLSGTDGCVSEDGSGGDCADGKALNGVTSVAVTSERKPKSVYVAANQSDAIDAFARSGS